MLRPVAFRMAKKNPTLLGAIFGDNCSITLLFVNLFLLKDMAGPGVQNDLTFVTQSSLAKVICTFYT